MARLILLLSLTVLASTVSCERSAPPVASAPAAPGTNQQRFEVKGLVVEIRPRQKEVEIKHEAIPGYMPAMTMPFEVKDTNELAGLEAGDAVSFRLTVTDTEGWIDQVRKEAKRANAAPATGAVTAVRSVEPLNPGDPLPEYHFTNQFGQLISTASFKGQALAINFLFTRCPFPTFCPRTANNFAETQQKLLSLPGAPTNWQLLTISFDPEFDKPQVLKAYGEGYKYDPSHWSLATGSTTEIMALSEQVGQTFWRDETGSISHNLRAVVVDDSGKVQKIFVGNQWTSDELVLEMIQAAAKTRRSEQGNQAPQPAASGDSTR